MIKPGKESVKNKETYFICIGASAGGLEPIKTFFKNLSDEINGVFFIIQHHSSKHESFLDQILSRVTDLPISIAEDGMLTKKNHIYIIPSNYFVSLYHKRVYFIENRKASFEFPINHFFESLAMDQKSKVIGIIMSGTGKDGSLGMKFIKDNGGVVITQTKETAQFSDMPMNIEKITTVDYRLSPEDMPREISEIIKNRKKDYNNNNLPPAKYFRSDLMKICHIIRRCSGIDFSHYKEELINKRVRIRMNLLDIEDINEYIKRLNNDLDERIKLFDALGISSKKFLHDEEICEAIKEKIFPILNDSKKEIRLWSIGCSTGEEVYSFTIILLEYLRTHKINLNIKVFATDLDASALNFAREGIYKREDLKPINDELIKKYFKKSKHGYSVLNKIKEMIVFAKHDLLEDPPFSKVDLINCRHVLMNYNKAAQYTILNSFHYALNNHGILIIGKRESLGDMAKAFEPIDASLKFYKFVDTELTTNNKKSTPFKSNTLAIDAKFNDSITEDKKDLKVKELIHIALEKYIKAGVLIDSNYKILRIFNDVYPYLKISKGKFSDDFFNNVSSPLALIITSTLKQLENGLNSISTEVLDLEEYKDFILMIEKLILDEKSYYLISFEKIETEQKKCTRIVTDFSKIDLNNLLEDRIEFLEE